MYNMKLFRKKGSKRIFFVINIHEKPYVDINISRYTDITPRVEQVTTAKEFIIRTNFASR